MSDDLHVPLSAGWRGPAPVQSEAVEEPYARIEPLDRAATPLGWSWRVRIGPSEYMEVMHFDDELYAQQWAEQRLWAIAKGLADKRQHLAREPKTVRFSDVVDV